MDKPKYKVIAERMCDEILADEGVFGQLVADIREFINDKWHPIKDPLIKDALEEEKAIEICDDALKWECLFF